MIQFQASDVAVLASVLHIHGLLDHDRYLVTILCHFLTQAIDDLRVRRCYTSVVADIFKCGVVYLFHVDELEKRTHVLVTDSLSFRHIDIV